jgi:hypothetical protein
MNPLSFGIVRFYVKPENMPEFKNQMIGIVQNKRNFLNGATITISPNKDCLDVTSNQVVDSNLLSYATNKDVNYSSPQERQKIADGEDSRLLMRIGSESLKTKFLFSTYKKLPNPLPKDESNKFHK